MFIFFPVPIAEELSNRRFCCAVTEEARRVECGVLVHCLAGISRSVTVAVAYLMSSMRLSLDDAYEQVKRCRPFASPSLNFMGQLLDFEASLSRSRHDRYAADNRDDTPEQ